MDTPTTNVLLVYLQNGRELRIGGVFSTIPLALEGAKKLIMNPGTRRQIDTARISPGVPWRAVTIEGWIVIEPHEVNNGVESF